MVGSVSWNGHGVFTPLATWAQKWLHKLGFVKKEEPTIMVSNKHYILEPGHGGTIDGKYTTPTFLWKRSYFDGEGNLLPPSKGIEWLEKNCVHKIYEGVINRKYTRKLSKMLDVAGIPHTIIPDSAEDWTLGKRVNVANTIARSCAKPTVLLDLHSNAGGGTGNEVFTSPGETESDRYADIIAEEFINEFPEFRFRKDTASDGDYDKEARFAMLVGTIMPAITVEAFFYDNWEDAQLLMSEEGTDRIAQALFKAIIRIDNEP